MAHDRTAGHSLRVCKKNHEGRKKVFGATWLSVTNNTVVLVRGFHRSAIFATRFRRSDFANVFQTATRKRVSFGAESLPSRVPRRTLVAK